MAAKKKLLLGGYFASMQDSDGKARYIDKLSILGGFDPYESERAQWLDDVDLWPLSILQCTCYIHQVAQGKIC